MYNCINVTKSTEKKVVSTVRIPDNMADILDEVMDYESSEVIVPNMDDHVFNEEDEGEAMENEDDDIGQNLKKLCVTTFYKYGWREINQLKVRKVRQVARNRVIRKRDVTKYTMKQVLHQLGGSTPQVRSRSSQIFHLVLLHQLGGSTPQVRSRSSQIFHLVLLHQLRGSTPQVRSRLSKFFIWYFYTSFAHCLSKGTSPYPLRS